MTQMVVQLTADELRALVREELARVVPARAPESREVLTRAQVAELLDVHPNSVPRYIRRGLPTHKVGGEFRFIRAEVMAWIAAQGVKGAT